VRGIGRGLSGGSKKDVMMWCVRVRVTKIGGSKKNVLPPCPKIPTAEYCQMAHFSIFKSALSSLFPNQMQFQNTQHLLSPNEQLLNCEHVVITGVTFVGVLGIWDINRSCTNGRNDKIFHHHASNVGLA